MNTDDYIDRSCLRASRRSNTTISSIATISTVYNDLAPAELGPDLVSQGPEIGSSGSRASARDCPSEHQYQKANANRQRDEDPEPIRVRAVVGGRTSPME